MQAPPQIYDLLVIGGGINGAAIARDASGRGLSVCVLEAGDPGGGTSWASSKLIHGGLRYLEHYAFGLVRESLTERSILLKTAAHLTRPCRFVLPHVPGMRPAWLIRAGLWLYDRLADSGHEPNPLPSATHVALDAHSDFGAPLRPGIQQGYLYFDVQVDDARLVILTLRDAAQRGADIRVRHRFVGGSVQNGLWHCRVRHSDRVNGEEETTLIARTLVNAAGPWVAQTLDQLPVAKSHPGVQLVRGSHIVVPRLYAGDHAYTLQNPDGRIIFLLPFGQDWTLIGTTDIRTDAPSTQPEPSAEEIEYLCSATSRHLRQPVTPAQIVWRFAGLRPLYDDGRSNPAKVTRDYRLIVDQINGATLLSVFGGKLTTHRHLAAAVMQRLQPVFEHLGPDWTEETPLAGSEGDFVAQTAEYMQAFAFLPEEIRFGLWQRHGTQCFSLLEGVTTVEQLGRYFGAGLTEREVRHFIKHEWAQTADDILWRRSKAGLALTVNQRADFEAWLSQQTNA